MGARNISFAGAYEGRDVLGGFGLGCPVINIGFLKNIRLNSETVEAYQVAKAESHNDSLSNVARSAIGYALIGPIGLLAGVSADIGSGLNLALVQFKDGQECVLEINDQLLEQLARACPGKEKVIITEQLLAERKAIYEAGLQNDHGQ